MFLKSNRINLGVQNVVLNCGNLKKNERVCLIYDKNEVLVPSFLFWIKKNSCVKVLKENNLKMHGQNLVKELPIL